LVHIYLDGTVLLTHGGVESGQGLHTKMLQVIISFSNCINSYQAANVCHRSSITAVIELATKRKT
jgi:xanthine dehydrogenase molybdopterin-binding subunit B